MTDRTRITLCGQLGITLDGAARESTLRGRQGRLLLAFLVLHRSRAVRRDELVEALWPQSGAPPSDTALAPVLSRLRAALAPATVEGRDALRLVLPEPVWVDVEAAGALVAAAGRALAAGDAAAAGRDARAAAELTAGGLLPDLEAPWLAGPRADVEELHVEALQTQARAGLAGGGDGLAAAERAARAAVAAAPFRESARAALIEVLAARGDVAEALRAYEDVRVLLREELGAVPGPELVALHERLVGADATPARPERSPSPPPPAASASAAGAPAADLVEREAELAQIDAALARLRAGTGGVLVFEGPAGIGKTRLLTALRDAAPAMGARVLGARASAMEREFGFGVVRQILETAVSSIPDPDDPARAVLEDTADLGVGVGSFAIMRALFEQCARLAAERPLVLYVDDLQWSDVASLRFAAYLVRRLDTVPILVAATVRTGEPDSDEVLLAEIAQDPSTVAVRPEPLTITATAALVRARLGGEPGLGFVAACHEVTAGNPLLLRQLLTALAAESVRPGDAGAAAVRAIGPRAVSRTVLLRLARLPAPAALVARAVAILGEQPPPEALARLAESDDTSVADALAALAHAEILRDEAEPGFVHPLVRDAVYHEIPTARRGLEHARTARVLRDLGASPERVAAQLLLAPPRGEPWVVDVLREASGVALDRGAPDAALTLLQRARAEPPAPDQRVEVALELGAAAEYVRGQSAVEPLRQAWRELADPEARATAAVMLARVLLFLEDPAAAIDVVNTAVAELPPAYEDLHDALRALRTVGVFFGVVDPAELVLVDEVRAGPRRDGPGAKTLTAITSLALAIRNEPADEAAALAAESLDGDALLSFDRGLFCVGPAIALAMADPVRGAGQWARFRAFAGRRGSLLDAVGADLWGGLALIWQGDLDTAVEQLRRALDGEALFGSRASAHMGYTPAFLALALVEQGELDAAWAALREHGDRHGASDGERFWLSSQGELLLASGRPAEVLPVTDALAATRPPGTHPLWGPWRGLRARALHQLGDADTAQALAADELALARRSGAPWVIGRALRQLAGLGPAASAVPLLREATALLDASSARLERAKAHAGLAAALAATGDAAGAAAARATARELAEACGARALAAGLRAVA